MKRRTFLNNHILLLFIYIVFLISCSTEEEKKEGELVIESIIPFISESRSKETDQQVEIEFQANLSSKTSEQEIVQDWVIEKISLENFDGFSSDELDKRSILSNSAIANSEGFWGEQKKEEPNKVIVVFYTPGYYKVTYNLTNYVDFQKKEILIKHGNIDLPELYFSLNLPPNEKDTSNDYIGTFEVYAGNIDATADLIELKFSEIRENWYNSKLNVDPIKQFAISSGIAIDIENKRNNTVSNDFFSFSDFVSATGKDLSELYVTEQLNIKDKAIELSIKNQKRTEEILYHKNTPLYYSVLNFGESHGKSFFTSSYDSIYIENLPFRFENTSKDISSSILFIGTAGLHFISSGYTVCFSAEGVLSDVVDPDKKRPYPAFPYGYLLGRLGKKGKIFPIGKHFISKTKKVEDFYIYDAEENSLKKQ